MSRRKIRVLFLSFQSNLSGAPRALFLLVKHLDRNRFEPAVLFNYDGPIVSEFKRIVPTLVLKKFNVAFLPARLKIPIRRLIHRRQFDRLMRSLQPDVVYINTIGKGETAEYTLARNGIKRVIHFHEIDGTVMDKFDDAWIERVTNRCDHFVGCAGAVSEFIVRCLGVDKARVITANASIDVADLLARDNMQGREVRRTLEIPEDALLVGAVGKPSFRKGLDLFIEAASSVRKARPDMDVHFMWVGGHDGIHAGRFMRSMYRRADFLGLNGRFHWVKEVRDASPYQAAMDLYVVSSREDPMPLGMLEAMLLGTPVVAFAVSGIPEALDNHGGMLVNRVCPESLASAIIDSLSRPEYRFAIAARGQKNVLERFDIAKNVRVIEDALLKLTGSGEVRG